MISFLGKPERACDGFTRREMLRVGGLSALGLSGGLGPAARGEFAGRAESVGFGKAKSCVLIYLFGGPSQIDTFDMKPDAPSQFRGEFKPIATRLPGLGICEHLPRLAARADKYCLIRGMNHEHPRHGWGLYYMLTGKKHNRPDLDAPPTPDDFPGPGALIAKLKPPNPGVPTAITLPRWNRFLDLPNDYAGERGGFLGSTFDPWLISPEQAGGGLSFTNLEISLDTPIGRLSDRESLFQAVGRRISTWSDQAGAFDRLHSEAYRLVSSSKVREAFRLVDESAKSRDRYGSHPFGQGLLLARRLVEAGATLIQVNWHNDGSDVKSPFWDTHKNNFDALKNRLLPPADVGISALLDDLDERGMLDETLVVVMGEFGRTPRIGHVVMNAATDKQGRDHWPHAYTVLVAGGGVKRGLVHGASDDRAAYVTSDAVSPPDLQATVLHLLGINPRTPVSNQRGRTFPASTGKPVTAILA